MLAAPFLARPVYKAGRGFVRGFKGRRDYEKALKANALPLPDPNRTVIEKGMFGRPRTTRRYVDPSMEFTPYEEVR
jgi:hypothetical protein